MKNFELLTNDNNRGIQYKNMTEIIGKYNKKPVSQTPGLKSTQMRSIMNAYRLVEAYKKESKLVYVGEQFPNELLFPFKVIPWNIESMAILFAQSVNVDDFFHLTQEKNLSRDICSYLRGPFGVMMANCYPGPDLILANDQPCDCLAKLEYMASRFYKAPFFTLNTPNEINDDTLAYLKNQMKSVLLETENVLMTKFKEEDFQEVIGLSNAAREYYCKTVQLHQNYYLPGVSRELLEIFGTNYFGLKETVQVCKTLYDEALEMSQKAESKKKRKRVLWVGQAPESSHDLLEHIEKELEVVFWAPLWEANLMYLDSHNPLKSIATRAILYHWNEERMRTETNEICDEFEIEGIIIANIWGCRNMMGISPMIRELAKEKNLKYLTINIDNMDRNNYSFTQMKNRTDAFIELMN
jgi:benzoyl-CoA reductase/2-hydroxyglutaryl-CoA dehydratase subunit BcrC/BadD/HgdB